MDSKMIWDRLTNLYALLSGDKKLGYWHDLTRLAIFTVVGSQKTATVAHPDLWGATLTIAPYHAAVVIKDGRESVTIIAIPPFGEVDTDPESWALLLALLAIAEKQALRGERGEQ